MGAGRSTDPIIRAPIDDFPTTKEGPVRLLITLTTAVVIAGMSYAVGSAFIRLTSSAPTPERATSVANTLSPHEIHLNYRRMRELPVHDVKDAF
jgi:hypothetical protein